MLLLVNLACSRLITQQVYYGFNGRWYHLHTVSCALPLRLKAWLTAAPSSLILQPSSTLSHFPPQREVAMKNRPFAGIPLAILLTLTCGARTPCCPVCRGSPRRSRRRAREHGYIVFPATTSSLGGMCHRMVTTRSTLGLAPAESPRSGAKVRVVLPDGKAASSCRSARPGKEELRAVHCEIRRAPGGRIARP